MGHYYCGRLADTLRGKLKYAQTLYQKRYNLCSGAAYNIASYSTKDALRGRAWRATVTFVDGKSITPYVGTASAKKSTKALDNKAVLLWSFRFMRKNSNIYLKTLAPGPTRDGYERRHEMVICLGCTSQ